MADRAHRSRVAAPGGASRAESGGRLSALAALGVVLVLAVAPAACNRGPAGAPPERRPLPPGVPAAEGPVDTVLASEPAVYDGTRIGEPSPREALPEGWPPAIPHPPGFEIERLNASPGALTAISGTHPAAFEDLLEWLVSHLSDEGWLVLQRDRLGSSARVRLARDEVRWLVDVGERRGEGGDVETWAMMNREPNQRPLADRPLPTGAWPCGSHLPPTPPRPQVTCELHVGRSIEALSGAVGEPDIAAADQELAVAFRSGQELMGSTLQDGEIAQSPRALVGIAREELDVSPRVVAVSGGRWVSWIDGEPPERRMARFDEAFERVGEPLLLSRDLGPGDALAFAPIGLFGGRGWAVAWTERAQGLVVFRSATLPADGDRLRRSGRIPPTGADPRVGPALASDGSRHLALVWGSDDGVFFRAVGPDGLPDQPERRIEPGPPSWVGVAESDDSFWVSWATTRRGFWTRTDVAGCTDDAFGSLAGIPEHAWSSALGPVVQVREGGETRLYRLADRGGAFPDTAPEVIGTSYLDLIWTDLVPVADGFAGLARTEAGIAPAQWVCE